METWNHGNTDGTSNISDYVNSILDTGGPCKSRIFGGRGDPRVANPRVTSNVLVLKP